MTGTIQSSSSIQVSPQKQNSRVRASPNISMYTLLDLLRIYELNTSQGINVGLALQSVQRQIFIISEQNKIKTLKDSFEESLVIFKKLKPKF